MSAISSVLLVSVIGAAPSAAATPQALTLEGAAQSATDSAPVQLSADLWLPAQTPAPAVVLAHGFGGSKESLVEQAQQLVDRGFVVLTYSARGFGESTGLISMNSPQFEVADASRIVDYLATRAEVTQDAPGDPRVGVAGGSYGGALALLLAGYDTRVDAVASDITWSSLESSLFGQSIRGSQAPGVYKEAWTAVFFSAGLTTNDGSVTTCGRFAPDWCAAYVESATTGVPSARTRILMEQSSPASIADKITAPTLLGGGQADSLFPLSQVNENAEIIRRAHPDVPLSVVWHAQGHDGGANESDRLSELTANWLSEHLLGEAAEIPAFAVSFVEGSALSSRADGQITVGVADSYPGLAGDSTVEIPVLGPPQQIAAPAGGVPAAVSSLPGLGQLAGAASAFNGSLPNQTAAFSSEPLTAPTRIVGVPTVRLAVSSETEVRDVVLFAAVRVAASQGPPTLPQGLVAPLRFDQVGPEPTVVEVELPTLALNVAAGERLLVTVTTTDQAYRLPQEPAVYSVAMVEPVLRVPQATLTLEGSGAPLWLWPLLAGVVVLLSGLALVLTRSRTGHGTDMREDLAEFPLAVVDLAKEYRGGVRAVNGVSFTVPSGVVLGLLGPNGAGKTTTMRMIMGLITPTSGAVYVNGVRVGAGSAALARIGTFIEGPGFLPYLTGRQNLATYWRSSGRSEEDEHLSEVLEIAGLGSAIDRKVRTYSQGMRQRLGIAQAMLGLPDILMLDEPTNGLDPPQIREMREVLQNYAASGRTVIISSHLLSEVEQTCSHVVVMHRGELITQSTVSELLHGRSGLRLEDVFMELVGEGHQVTA